jgi:ribonuclease VapC
MGKESLGISKKKSVVLDSWAVIAYLEDEPSAEKIEDIMAETHDAGIPLLMTVVNLGEVWYSTARRLSEKSADQCVEDIRNLGVTIVDADWSLTNEAARFKRKGRIAYADCFAAALAKREGSPLVTGDPEFKSIESSVTILWI